MSCCVPSVDIVLEQDKDEELHEASFVGRDPGIGPVRETPWRARASTHLSGVLWRTRRQDSDTCAETRWRMFLLGIRHFPTAYLRFWNTELIAWWKTKERAVGKVRSVALLLSRCGRNRAGRRISTTCNQRFANLPISLLSHTFSHILKHIMCFCLTVTSCYNAISSL